MRAEEKFGTGFYAAPRVENFVGRVKKEKCEEFLTNAELVQDFISGYKLQGFCNHPDNKVRTGMLMQVAVGVSAYRYPMSCGDYVDGLMIFTDRLSGCELHQKVTSIDRKKERWGTKIYHCETFYLTKKGDLWLAIPLLADEGWRKEKQAGDALLKWAKMRRCKVVGKVRLATGTIVHKHEDFCSSEMWTLEVISEHGRRKHLAVMFENGKMIAGDATELRVVPKCISEGGVLRTKYNWYRYYGGEFTFIK